jgi:hypothetical protein
VAIWFDDPSDTRGELLCSFQLIAIEELAKVPLNDITPPMRDVEVEVNVVGVRELLSYNNGTIGAPFIEIDAGDRSTVDKVPQPSHPSRVCARTTYRRRRVRCACAAGLRQVRKTRPSSTPSGPDANFLDTLAIHTRLPEDLLFCPSLNVRVFDFRGADNTPVIGKVRFQAHIAAATPRAATPRAICPLCGPICGPLCGPLCGPICGPLCGPICGPLCGPICGPDDVSTGEHPACAVLRMDQGG